jgi:NhaP-type Na+/H+ or K+/H+ antiporter
MPFACILLLAGRKKLRMNSRLMLVLIGAVGAVALVGCSYTNTTTPAGTTAVTITATSGATSHTSTVNLTVK